MREVFAELHSHLCKLIELAGLESPPDWAIVDLRVPPNSRYPGKIVDADFFNEAWALKPQTE